MATTRMLGSTRSTHTYNPATTRGSDEQDLPRLRAARPVRTVKRRENRTWPREQA